MDGDRGGGGSIRSSLGSCPAGRVLFPSPKVGGLGCEGPSKGKLGAGRGEHCKGRKVAWG